MGDAKALPMLEMLLKISLKKKKNTQIYSYISSLNVFIQLIQYTYTYTYTYIAMNEAKILV